MGRDKRTPEQIAKAKQDKINATLNNFEVQLMQLAKRKASLLNKVTESRRLGLKQQETEARALLSNCLGQEKRVYSMQMQLELFNESKDLSNLEQSFIDCVSQMSDEISSNVTKSKVQKSKKKYIKSLFNINKQNERIDDMLSVGDTATMSNFNSDRVSEFDDVIDKMVEDAENSYIAPSKNKLF